MPVVNMQDAKTRLSQLVARAEAGEEIVLARAGRPAVRLTPVAPQHVVRGYGQHPELAALGDAVLEPLPEEELALWEGAGAEGTDDGLRAGG